MAEGEREPIGESQAGEPPAAEDAAPGTSAGQGLPQYYAVLGVRPGDSREKVAEAYDRLARRLQPDVNAPPVDPERLRLIEEAFDVLDDPARRAEYDRAHGIDAPPAGPGLAGDRRLLMALGLIAVGVVAIVAAIVVLIVGLASDGGSRLQITTASGLRYVDLKTGDGRPAAPGDQVSVYYVGKYEDGRVFDNSREKTPFTFIIGRSQVMEGMMEGVTDMREGGKRRLFIPVALAGRLGALPEHPVNVPLVYDVELIRVEPGVASPDSPPDVEGEEVTTASGLRYIELEEGAGVIPQDGQRVSVHYTGWLESDGTKFDSSIDRGQPIEFTLGRGEVIDGWEEGIGTMRVGGKRRLIIPPELAYGAEGAPPVIPPNATLIFDVQLLDLR